MLGIKGFAEVKWFDKDGTLVRTEDLLFTVSS
jgi:hypothetical protein